MPDILAPQLQLGAGPPDRMVTFVPDVSEQETRYLAIEAVHRARQTMPRVSGATANRLQPIHDEGWFGLYFPDSWTWFMEHGTRPFTMKSLAGKVVPMWVSDEDGSLRRANPKVKTRRTEDGRQQVLIFRRAARMGQRKVITRKNPVTGKEERTTTVASYPGAPGRINRRYSGQGFQGPHGTAQPGMIASGNGGVRWRHPGLRAQQFLNSAIASTVFHAGLLIGTVYATDGAAWETELTRRMAV